MTLLRAKLRLLTAGVLAFFMGDLLFPRALEAQSAGTVIVDAGHGGFDRGGVPRQRIGEKNMTLDVSQRLKRVLEASGYRVVMTRNSDVFIPLGRRVAIANSYRNAVFVSVHFNSARRSGANGIETYYYRRDSSSLAAAIHRNVVAGAPSENRGIRRRGFWVLRRTAIPSVLVECGFLTNPMEARHISTASYRQKLAENIARGVRRQQAPISRPLARGAASSPDVLPQPFLAGSDFVRAEPRRKKKRAKKKPSKKARKKKSSSSKKTPAKSEG